MCSAVSSSGCCFRARRTEVIREAKLFPQPHTATSPTPSSRVRGHTPPVMRACSTARPASLWPMLTIRTVRPWNVRQIHPRHRPASANHYPGAGAQVFISRQRPRGSLSLPAIAASFSAAASPTKSTTSPRCPRWATLSAPYRLHKPRRQPIPRPPTKPPLMPDWERKLRPSSTLLPQKPTSPTSPAYHHGSSWCFRRVLERTGASTIHDVWPNLPKSSSTAE